MGESEEFVKRSEYADIVVIVVTYNSASTINHLFADLRRDAFALALRVVVVDNDSTDCTANLVAAQDDVYLIQSGGNLGYAAGINRARRHIEQCGGVLVLNPDLRLREGALKAMLSALAQPGVGAVVPLNVFDESDGLDLTLRREPSILGALGDALVGGRRFARRPKWLTETELRRETYTNPHTVDWATGAAIMIRPDVGIAVGDWDERYFLYSEETDYCRRIRDRGYQVWFEPAARVQHSGGGSGSSSALASLMAVNKVRYIERHRRKPYAVAYRGVIALGEALRARDPAHRQTFAVLLRRSRWRRLPPGR